MAAVRVAGAQRREQAEHGAGAVLDLHEGLSTPGPAEIAAEDGRYPDPRFGGCPRWPEGHYLLSTHGQIVRGRCKATNQCDYCAKLAAVENTEMLALDAMEGAAPEVWCVLTTRTATLDMSLFYVAREKFIKALRRRFPGCQYACLLEFTTGYGPRSGGARRPHWNLLLKGIPADAIDVVRDLVDRIWCGHVDALPFGQHVGRVREAGGLMRYIALHFQKESQAPPAGFRGQRFNCSRGYFTGRSRADARADAKESLWFKRQLHRAHELGLEGDDAEDWIDAQLAREGLPEWSLYVVARRQVDAVPPGESAPVPARLLLAAFLELVDASTELEAGTSNPPAAHGAADPPRGPQTAADPPAVAP